MFKKIMIFVFVMLFMFIGIDNVSAATGLYCIYPNKGNNNPDIMLVQDSSGNKYVYAVKYPNLVDNLKYDSFVWQPFFDENGNYVFNKAITDFSLVSSSHFDDSGNLISCPEYYVWKDNKYENIQFTSTTGHYKIKLDSSLSKYYTDNRKADEFNYFDIASDSDYIINESNFTSSTYTEQWLVQPNYGNQSCLYTHDSGDGLFESLQLDIDYKNDKVRVSFATYYKKLWGIFGSSGIVTLTSTDLFSTDLYYGALERYDNNSCPYQLFGKWKDGKFHFSYSFGSFGVLIEPERFNLTNSLPKITEHQFIVDPPIDIDSCEELLGKDLIEILRSLVTVGKIFIPLLLLVLGIVDFIKATFAMKEDDMKKVTSKFIKRVIVAVIIFLIPDLLKLLLSIADSIWGNFDPDLCDIL